MSPKPRKANIFDMLRYLTTEKRKWKDLTDNEKKLSPYLINKWLSMNTHLLEAINDLQYITVGVLSNREVYNLYLDILPDFKMFFRYIKGKNVTKYKDELVNVVCLHLSCSKSEAIDYLDVLYMSDGSTQIISEFLEMYGFSQTEINK